MKTIFITIFDADTAKNIFRTDTWKVLKSRPGIRYVLLVDPAKLDYYAEQFGGRNVIIEPFERIRPSRFGKVVQSILRYSLPISTVAIRNRYILHSSYNIPKYIFFQVLYLMSFSIKYRRLLRYVARKFIAKKPLSYIFDKYNPDLVVSGNISAHEDANLLLEAKKYALKTIGRIKSWDTATIKGLIPVFPDHLIVINEKAKEDVVMLQNFPEEKIFVSGFPQYDIYFRREGITSREDFFSSIGADLKKKLIFYCAIGDWFSPQEHEIIEMLDDSLSSGEIGHPAQILVRPHPKYKGVDDKLSSCKNIIFDRPGTYTDGTRSSWEFESRDIKHLINSLEHCDVLMTTASSMSIEGCIFKKPVINIAFDGYKKIHPAISVARFSRQWHYEPLVKAGGIKMVYNREDLIAAVNEYLRDKSKDKEGRESIVDFECMRRDGKSGEFIADYILSHIY